MFKFKFTVIQKFPGFLTSSLKWAYKTEKEPKVVSLLKNKTKQNKRSDNNFILKITLILF